MPETRVKCPSCETVLKLTVPVSSGKAIKCPKCGAAIRVPAPAGKLGEPVAPRAAARLQPARVARRPEPEEEEVEEHENLEEDEEPRKRKRKKRDEEEDGSRKTLLWLGIGGGAAALLGVVVLVIVLKGSGKGGADGKGGGDNAMRELDSFNTGVPEISDEQGAVLDYGLAVTRDGKTAVVSAPKGANKLRIFDLDEQKQVASAELNQDWFHQVCVSPDNRWLACYVQQRGTIELRNLKTGALDRVLKPEKQFGGGSLRLVTFSPRSDLIVGVDDRDVFGWDCKSGRQAFSFRAHEERIVGQAFLPDGRLVTSGQDQLMKIWDLSKRSAVKTIQLDKGVVDALVVSPDGKLAGSMQEKPPSDTGKAFSVFIWDLEKGTKVSTMRDEHIYGLKMRFLPGNKLLAIGGGFSFVLWDIPSGTKKAVLQEGTSIKDREMIYDFDVTEDGTVFIFRWDGRLQRWEVKE